MKMMQTILYLNDKARVLISLSIPISRIKNTGLFDKLIKIKYDIPNNRLEQFDDYIREIDKRLSELIKTK